jgi:hypothetical protein
MGGGGGGPPRPRLPSSASAPPRPARAGGGAAQPSFHYSPEPRPLRPVLRVLRGQALADTSDSPRVGALRAVGRQQQRGEGELLLHRGVLADHGREARGLPNPQITKPGLLQAREGRCTTR